MPTAKVAVTIDEQLLREVDRWVAAGEFPSRSRAVQSALARLREERAKRRSLLVELTKLDPTEERALADEILSADTAATPRRPRRPAGLPHSLAELAAFGAGTPSGAGS